MLNDIETYGKSTIQSGVVLDSGHQFCKKYNGILALQGAENRLYMKSVDWQLMDKWREEGLKRTNEVTLEMFNEVPEHSIQEYVDLYTETMNQQPLGEIETRSKISAESRRINETRFKEKGLEWTTIISREKDGRISGLTEIFYINDYPHEIEQGLIGVKEEYPGKGLGKWLKAQMAFFIKDSYPSIDHITTGNANENAAMLSINNRMGFKEHQSGTSYKFRTDELSKKLGLTISRIYIV